MKDYNDEILYKGKAYKLIFDLNVMEEIQDEYGTFGKWAELTVQNEPNIKALKFAFFAMVNEGIRVSNEDNGTDEPEVTKQFIGRMLTEFGIVEATKKLTNIVENSAGDDRKNE